MTPPVTLTDVQKLRWFRNSKPGESFDTGSTSLDFSLQLGVGIQNLQVFQASVRDLAGFFSHKLASPNAEATKAIQTQYRFTRDPD
jgi:hypothetical protein